MEFNAGFFRGDATRWANMGVENVNRITNRFQYKQKGWCTEWKMFVICALTKIKANMLAFESATRGEMLRRTQPNVYQKMKNIIHDCRNLRDMRKRMTEERQGVCLEFRTDKKEMKRALKQDMKQYMVQFSSQRLEDADAAIGDWVKRWQTKNRTDSVKPRVSLALLLQCQADVRVQQGAEPALSDIVRIFARFGYQLLTTQDSRQLSRMMTALRKDQEKYSE